MKATEQYFPVLLFIMLYNLIQMFDSVDEILQLMFGNFNFASLEVKNESIKKRKEKNFTS